MKEPFDLQEELIIVEARLWGPKGTRGVRLVLDTGATMTVVRTSILYFLGYDPSMQERLPMMTGSGVEYVPQVSVDKIEAIGKVCTELIVLSHTLPPTANVDGLLGLDFFRGQELTIDFRNGNLSLD